jgi:hypothetical protein
MRSYKVLQVTLTTIISLVWLINGLICKILNVIPRHEQIVSEILGNAHSSILTKGIGVLEVLMAVWIISGIKSKICSVFQMVVVGAMNIIEFAAVPDLLLFRKFNIFFAACFISMIYINEFVLKTRNTVHSENQ